MHQPQSTATSASQRDAATPQDDLISSFVEIRIDRLYTLTISSELEIMVGSGDQGHGEPNSEHPTELELQILKVLWDAEPMTVREVREALAASDVIWLIQP